jgi:hypothetical protein
MYQHIVHIVVEAENLEVACKKGIGDDIDWDTQEMDSDSARATTITGAKVIPDALEFVPGDIILRRDRPATRGFGVPGCSLSRFLYEDEAETGPLLEIPEQFTDDE